MRKHFSRAALANVMHCIFLILLFGAHGDQIQASGLLVILGLNLSFSIGCERLVLSQIMRFSTGLMVVQVILGSLIFPLGPVFLCLNLPLTLAAISLFRTSHAGRRLLALAVFFPIVKWALGWDDLLSLVTPVKPALAICTIVTSAAIWFVIGEVRKRSEKYSSKFSASYNEIRAQNEVIANQQKQLFLANHELERISEKLSVQTLIEEQLTWNLQQKTGDQRSMVHAIHHDLREPLRNIVSFTQLIERKLAGQPEAKNAIEYLEFAKDGGTRMTAMLDDLLRYTKDVEEEMIPVDLNGLLEELKVDLGDTLRRNNGTIKFGKLPIVIGLPTQLRQLFQNLISNALKFSKENELPAVEVSVCSENKGRVNICVSDNGIGIPNSQLETVFKLFSRAKNSETFAGSGIGLSLCKKICLKHGADLFVESEVNVGSTFTIIGLELEGAAGRFVFDIKIPDHVTD